MIGVNWVMSQFADAAPAGASASAVDASANDASAAIIDFMGGLLAFAPRPDAVIWIMPDFAGGGKLRWLRAE